MIIIKKSKGISFKQRILFGTMCLLIGVFMITYFVGSLKKYNYKNKTFIETIAYVYDYKFNNDESEAALKIEYEVDGRTYYATSKSYSSDPELIGSPILIKYNPKNPQDIIWNSDRGTYIVFVIFGGLFIVTGFAIYFVKNIGITDKEE